MGYANIPNVAVGDVLTSTTYNQLIDNAEMGNPTFATEALRNSWITAPTEGQRAYITGSTETLGGGVTQAYTPTGIQTIHNGTGWVTVTPVGGFSSASATTTSGTFVSTLTGDATPITATLRTGTTVLIQTMMRCTTAAAVQIWTSVSISGATTLTAAANTYSVSTANTQAGTTVNTICCSVIHPVSAGVNTFTLNYAISGGATLTATGRSLIVQGVA